MPPARSTRSPRRAASSSDTTRTCPASASRSTCLVGKQKMPRQAVVLGAGGGARAVVHGLVTEGFQRIIVFNRHLHRAEALVKFFGRSAAHMELRAMPWHESIIEAELSPRPRPRQRHLGGPGGRRQPDPRRALPGDLLVLDLVYNPPRTRLLRDAAAAGCATPERRADAAAPGRGRLQAVDGHSRRRSS